MKNCILILVAYSFAACSSFSDISDATKFEKEDGYTKVYNLQANIQSLTFGDFKFATNKTQFKQLNESGPVFKNILFYAKTTDVTYEYYLLYNPKKTEKKDKFIYKDTLIANSRFVLAISENAPGSDIEFIMDKLTAIKK